MLNLILNYSPPDSGNLWSDTDKIAFSIGNLHIAWYAIFIMCAFALAITLICIKMWKYYKIPIDPFYWFIIIGVPGAIFGARIWSCVIGNTDWEHFFQFSSGGLAIEGGVMLDVILAYIYFPLVLKRPKFQIRDLGSGEPQVRKISIWVYADAIIPAILIAQFLGRWGNYFNQELYGGIVTDEGLQKFLHDCLPWMWVGPEIGGAYHQPLFLWEGLCNVLGFLLIFIAAEFIPKKKAGDLAMSYFIWYGIIRLCMEPLRVSDFAFTLTYWTSGFWVLLGVCLIILNHTIMPKLRKYQLASIYKNTAILVWNKISIFFTSQWFNTLLFFKNKKTLAKKQKINETIIQKKKFIMDNYNIGKNNYKRSDSKMLYYFKR